MVPANACARERERVRGWGIASRIWKRQKSPSRVLIQSAGYIGSAAHFSPLFLFRRSFTRARGAVNSCVPRASRAFHTCIPTVSPFRSRSTFSLFPRLSFFGANIMNIDKPSLLLYFSIYPLLRLLPRSSPVLFSSLLLSLSLLSALEGASYTGSRNK